MIAASSTTTLARMIRAPRRAIILPSRRNNHICPRRLLLLCRFPRILHPVPHVPVVPERLYKLAQVASRFVGLSSGAQPRKYAGNWNRRWHDLCIQKRRDSGRVRPILGWAQGLYHRCGWMPKSGYPQCRVPIGVVAGREASRHSLYCDSWPLVSCARSLFSSLLFSPLFFDLRFLSCAPPAPSTRYTGISR